MRYLRPGLVAATLLLVPAFALTNLVLTTGADARSRGAKRSKVGEIIVHATGGPFCQGGKVVFSPSGTGPSMKKFFEANGTVSIHYIVDRDGTVIKSINEDEVAIHTVGHNDNAVGIELINHGDGREPYPEVQVEALAKLVKGIQQRWHVPLSQVKGHEDVDHSTFQCAGKSARRKQDPGPLFPWDKVRAQLQAAEKAGR